MVAQAGQTHEARLMDIQIPPTQDIVVAIAVLIVIGIVGGWVYLKFFGAKQ